MVGTLGSLHPEHVFTTGEGCKAEKGGRSSIALACTCIFHPPALPSSCGSSFCSALCQRPVTGLNMANSLLEFRCLEERKTKKRVQL